MTKYVVDLPDNVSFIVGKGYVLFNEKEFLRIPVKQLEKYSKKEDVEVEKDEEIVYDVRKEEQMSEKYVVSQEFMNELEEWKKRGNTDVYFVGSYDISMLPIDVIRWWDYPEINNSEQNNRLIAIIRWVNGEDVFEVEKPKKWVVRSKETDNKGNYMYGYIVPNERLKYMEMAYGKYQSAYFDTKEEAESWANAHQEVVEVVDV